MAIFNLDYINECNNNEEEYSNTDTILDSMLEACDTMLDSVEALSEGGARMKYLKKLEDRDYGDIDERKEFDNKYSKMSKEEKREIDKKLNKDYSDLSKYSGAEPQLFLVTEKPSEHIKNVGKSDYMYRDLRKTDRKKYKEKDTGKHDKFSKSFDYLGMAASKKAKDRFNRDFGGPEEDKNSLNNRINERIPMVQRYEGYKKTRIEDNGEDSNRIQRRKRDMKDYAEWRDKNKKKAAAVKEACEYMLALLDSLDED